MEMDYNLKKLRLNFSSVSERLQNKIDICSRGLISLCKLRLYLSLDDQSLSFSWVKLPTTNFRIVKTKNPRISRDVAPLSGPGFSLVCLVQYETRHYKPFISYFRQIIYQRNINRCIYVFCIIKSKEISK